MRLRAQLVLTVGIFSICLLSVAGFVLVNSLREREMERYRLKMAVNAGSVPVLIALPFWDLDTETIKASLTAVFSDEDIQRLALRDTGGAIVAAFDRPGGGELEIQRLDVSYNGYVLGQVEIAYTTANIDTAVFMLVLNYSLGVFVFLVAVSAVIVAASLSITRPLGQIAEALAETGSGNFDRRLEIPARGELAVLVASVNDLRAALVEREKTIAAVSMASARNETKFLMEQEQRRQEESLRHDLEASLDSLRRAQQQLIASEKMAVLGGLVAGVAHEINTPLGVGVTAASFLDDLVERFEERQAGGPISRADLDAFVDGVRESSRLLQSNLKRAAELIRSFKQVSVDQASEQMRRFNVGQYLGEVISSLRPRLRGRNIEVGVDCPAELAVDSYPGALAQIFTNLIINSLIHGFRGRERGVIAIAVRAPDAHRLEVVYADDGVGVDEAAMPHLFEPFYTSMRNEGGTGLGTYTVYNLVTQRFGGTIAAESRPGQGLIYRFTLRVELAGLEAIP